MLQSMFMPWLCSNVPLTVLSLRVLASWLHYDAPLIVAKNVSDVRYVSDGRRTICVWACRLFGPKQIPTHAPIRELCHSNFSGVAMCSNSRMCYYTWSGIINSIEGLRPPKFLPAKLFAISCICFVPTRRKQTDYAVKKCILNDWCIVNSTRYSDIM